MLKMIILLLSAAIVFVGCAGPLKVNYQSGSTQDIPHIKDNPVIHIKPYIDSRGNVGPHYLGKITATVSDINSDKLILEQDVAQLVTEAVSSHLAAAGFNVKGWSAELEAADGAGLIISGEVKKFRLDIAARDEIEFELSTTVVEKKTGKVIWAGTISEKNDRYAGVMGDSRRKIAGYISKTLQTALNRTLKEINANIQPASPLPVPGFAGIRDTSIPEGFGRLMIKTEPPRSQVYIGDVYYGLSPLNLDMAPGVYDAVLRLNGFKTVREKISIRNRDVTEMDMVMEKE